MPTRTSLKGHRRTQSCYSEPFRLSPSWCRNRYGIPIPRPFVEQPNKKSHAKKQPDGHIPRPRNRFVLFRCNFVNQELVPPHEFKDHSIISQIAGKVWESMSSEEKAPWVEMANEEKLAHLARYGPRKSRARKACGTKFGDDDDTYSTICALEHVRVKLELEDTPLYAFTSKHTRAVSEPARTSYDSFLGSMEPDMDNDISLSSSRRPSGLVLYMEHDGMSFGDNENVLNISPSDLNSDLGLSFFTETFPRIFVDMSHALGSRPSAQHASTVDPFFGSDHESKYGHDEHEEVQRLADYREYRTISQSSHSGRLDAISSASHLDVGSPSCSTGYNFDAKVTIKVEEDELKLVDDFMNWRGFEE